MIQRGAAEPSSMTRLIEEASRGRKFLGFTKFVALITGYGEREDF